MATNTLLDMLDTYSGAKDVRSWWGDKSDPTKALVAALAAASVLPWGAGLKGLRMAPDGLSGGLADDVGKGFGSSDGMWNRGMDDPLLDDLSIQAPTPYDDPAHRAFDPGEGQVFDPGGEGPFSIFDEAEAMGAEAEFLPGVDIRPEEIAWIRGPAATDAMQTDITRWQPGQGELSAANDAYNVRRSLIDRFSSGFDPDEMSDFFRGLPVLPALDNPGAAAVDRMGKLLPEGMYRAGGFDPMEYGNPGYDSFQSRIPFLHQGGTPAEGIFAGAPVSLREVLETMGLRDASELGQWMAERRQSIGIPGERRGGWQTELFGDAMEGVPMMSPDTDLRLKDLWGQTAQGPSSVVIGPRGFVHGDLRADYISPKGYDAYNPWEGGIMMPRVVQGHNMVPTFEAPTDVLDAAGRTLDAGGTRVEAGLARPDWYARAGNTGWPTLYADEIEDLGIEDAFALPFAGSETSFADPRYMHPQLRALARALASMKVPFKG